MSEIFTALLDEKCQFLHIFLQENSTTSCYHHSRISTTRASVETTFTMSDGAVVVKTRKFKRTKQTAIISTVPSLLYSRVWGWKIIRIITGPMVVDKVVCVVNPLWVSVSHRCAPTYLFLVSRFAFSHSTHFLP